MASRSPAAADAAHAGERILVKICGLRESAHASAACDAGAELLGFVLAPSRRQVAPEHVRRIRSDLYRSGREVEIAGVFVNETAHAINAAVQIAGLDVVQLSGDEPPSLLDDIDVPVVKVIRPAAGWSEDAVRAEAERWLDRRRPAALLLLDGHVAGSYGGTGTLTDWTMARQLAQRYPLLLAGGLTPANVAGAIESVGPVGVDVSSGVEREGVKELAKIVAFVARAHASAAPTTLRPSEARGRLRPRRVPAATSPRRR